MNPRIWFKSYRIKRKDFRKRLVLLERQLLEVRLINQALNRELDRIRLLNQIIEDNQ